MQHSLSLAKYLTKSSNSLLFCCVFSQRTWTKPSMTLIKWTEHIQPDGGWLPLRLAHFTILLTEITSSYEGVKPTLGCTASSVSFLPAVWQRPQCHHSEGQTLVCLAVWGTCHKHNQCGIIVTERPHCHHSERKSPVVSGTCHNQYGITEWQRPQWHCSKGKSPVVWGTCHKYNQYGITVWQRPQCHCSEGKSPVRLVVWDTCQSVWYHYMTKASMSSQWEEKPCVPGGVRYLSISMVSLYDKGLNVIVVRGKALCPWWCEIPVTNTVSVVSLYDVPLLLYCGPNSYVSTGLTKA